MAKANENNAVAKATLDSEISTLETAIAEKQAQRDALDPIKAAEKEIVDLGNDYANGKIASGEYMSKKAALVAKLRELDPTNTHLG